MNDDAKTPSNTCSGGFPTVMDFLSHHEAPTSSQLGHSVFDKYVRHPTVQTLAELSAALHQEWWAITRRHIQRLAQGMRRFEKVTRVGGGYTRY